MENIFWVELRRGVFSRNDVSPLFLTRILSCKKFSFLLTLACVDMDNYSWEISIWGPASVSTICPASTELQSCLSGRIVLDISTRVIKPHVGWDYCRSADARLTRLPEPLKSSSPAACSYQPSSCRRTPPSSWSSPQWCWWPSNSPGTVSQVWRLPILCEWKNLHLVS